MPRAPALRASSRLASATAAAGPRGFAHGRGERDELDARRAPPRRPSAIALPPMTIAGMTTTDDHHAARSSAFVEDRRARRRRRGGRRRRSRDRPRRRVMASWRERSAAGADDPLAARARATAAARSAAPVSMWTPSAPVRPAMRVSLWTRLATPRAAAIGTQRLGEALQGVRIGSVGGDDERGDVAAGERIADQRPATPPARCRSGVTRQRRQRGFGGFGHGIDPANASGRSPFAALDADGLCANDPCHRSYAEYYSALSRC